jgi:hypothetical protein
MRHLSNPKCGVVHIQKYRQQQSIVDVPCPGNGLGMFFGDWQTPSMDNGKSVDARGAGTKSETHRPVDVGGQKSNN